MAGLIMSRPAMPLRIQPNIRLRAGLEPGRIRMRSRTAILSPMRTARPQIRSVEDGVRCALLPATHGLHRDASTADAARPRGRPAAAVGSRAAGTTALRPGSRRQSLQYRRERARVLGGLGGGACVWRGRWSTFLSGTGRQPWQLSSPRGSGRCLPPAASGRHGRAEGP